MAERLTLLFSIRPQFADAIMRGEKRFELRRRRPKIEPGGRVIVYSSTPIRALIGSFVVPTITVESLESLWKHVANGSCVSRDDFLAYFDGLKSGVAIAIAEPNLFPDPIPLAELRRLWPGFHPPQSFQYLGKARLEALPRSARNLLV